MRSALVLAVSLLACSSGGLEGHVYRGDGFAFEFRPPADGWRRVDVTAAPIAYRNDRTRGTMMINARCGKENLDVPLKALHNHLFMMFTDEKVHHREVVPFDDREALHTEMSAKLDGVPMRYDVWVLKKDTCVYDLLYMAPEKSFAEGRDAFRALVKGFATVRSDDD